MTYQTNTIGKWIRKMSNIYFSDLECQDVLNSQEILSRKFQNMPILDSLQKMASIFWVLWIIVDLGDGSSMAIGEKTEGQILFQNIRWINYEIGHFCFEGVGHVISLNNALKLLIKRTFDCFRTSGATFWETSMTQLLAGQFAKQCSIRNISMASATT